MKLPVVLISLLVSVKATNFAEIWNEFKSTHGKTYSSLAEDTLRYSIFKSAYEDIQVHNDKYQRGEESYYLKINKFADLTDNEFVSIFLNYKVQDLPYGQRFHIQDNTVAPDSCDWREKGAVLSVHNGGYCGASYAFSALGAVEGQNVIKHNISVALSDQEIVDCSTENHGCISGDVRRVYDYIKANGISTYSSYPHIDGKGPCRNGTNSGVNVTGYVQVPMDEESLKQAVAFVGPIAVGINAAALKFYAGGIFDYPKCSKVLNHPVLAVGYGTTNNTDYWLIKNSWGKSWGEDGYVKMRRNQDQQCGISLDNSYPLID